MALSNSLKCRRQKETFLLILSLVRAWPSLPWGSQINLPPHRHHRHFISLNFQNPSKTIISCTNSQPVHTKTYIASQKHGIALELKQHKGQRFPVLIINSVIPYPVTYLQPSPQKSQPSIGALCYSAQQKNMKQTQTPAERELTSHSAVVPNVSVHHPLWLQKNHQEGHLGQQEVVLEGLSDIKVALVPQATE